MAFRFIDPGPLLDRELELVAPSIERIDEMLESCAHPQCTSDPGTSSVTRDKLIEMLEQAPGGRQPADAKRGLVPQYHFWMRLRDVDGRTPVIRIAGRIGLRVGTTHDVEQYLGNFGYNVHPPARGHHYAERACRLLLPLARAHGMKTLWVTCNPDNFASRRTCERLGCKLVGTVMLPSWHTLRKRGDTTKCRYRLDL